MGQISSIDTSRFSVAISRDLSMSLLENRWGPHRGVDGLTVAFADMRREPPHGGERHPDGDELIYVVSGRVRVVIDSNELAARELASGEACIVPKGEWHRVRLLEPTRLIAITPGPRHDYRPLRPAGPGHAS